MDLTCNLCTGSRAPNSFDSTTRRHRHPPTVVCLPIFARFEQKWAFGGSLEIMKFRKLQYIRREVSCNAEVASGQGRRGAENGGEAEAEAAAAGVPCFDISRLEAYTDRFRTEVLCVNALLEDEEEEDQVIVFKGFSSSLTRATSDDPSDPTLPPTAAIQSIDRLRAPYNPSKPQYIEQGLSWKEFRQFLEVQGL